MYEYIFVPVKPQGMFSRDIPYKEVINDYAKMGWRFVSAIPSRQSMDGVNWGYDLVFEKEIPKERM